MDAAAATKLGARLFRNNTAMGWAGKVVIVSPEENGGDSGNVLKNLDEWIIKVKPTLVHLNCGLHDLKFAKKYQVDPVKYEANLGRGNSESTLR